VPENRSAGFEIRGSTVTVGSMSDLVRSYWMMARVMIVPLVLAAYAAPARAEIRVEGSASDLHIDARDAPVADVLGALAKRFGLRIRGTVGDRHISADFDGSLHRVIARVLDGYDYVIRTRGEGMEVTVLGTASSHAVPSPIYAPPTYPAAKLRRDE
jgi:hypothetical protein